MRSRGRHAAHTQHIAKSRALVVGAVGLLAGGLAVVGIADPSLKLSNASGFAAPAVPTMTVCGNSSLLTGPSTPPAGAVVIPAGLDDDTSYSTPNTTYWFAPGTHVIGTGEYDQIQPGNGDTYIGVPGAIFDGQYDNHSAFAGGATNVTIEYLTIEHFDAPGGEGAVNYESSANWTIEHNTLTLNSPGRQSWAVPTRLSNTTA